MKNIFLIFIFQGILLSQINYSEHISPIIYNKCTSCHRLGESGPMSFTSYEEVASLGSMIEYVTQNDYMPPWPPDPGYTSHSMLDERFLTENEKVEQFVIAVIDKILSTPYVLFIKRYTDILMTDNIAN